MNIESKLWHMRSYNDGYVHITQNASGVIRTVSRGTIPHIDQLAMMNESAFDNVARNAFHGWTD